MIQFLRMRYNGPSAAGAIHAIANQNCRGVDRKAGLSTASFLRKDFARDDNFFSFQQCCDCSRFEQLLVYGHVLNNAGDGAGGAGNVRLQFAVNREEESQ